MAQVYLFGDSITWGSWDPEGGGWAQRLRTEIDRWQIGRDDQWHPVYNLGIPGDTSAGVMQRLSAEVKARFDPNEGAVILIGIGINDSVVHLGGSPESISVVTYQKNLAAVFKAAVEWTTQVGFIGLVPIDDTNLNPVPWDPSKAYRFGRALEFNSALGEFARAQRIPLLDFWDEWVSTDYKTRLFDGLHPNSRGHEVIAEQVKEFLRNNFIPQLFD